MTSALTSQTKHSLLKTGLVLLFIAPIVMFCLPILMSGSSFSSGDFDMQVQMTEAARTSIVSYGQFPMWNPWVSGGVPLFADPQFGLFTPQTLLSFFTNSAFAWKLTFFFYLVVAFFSMKALLKDVGLKNRLVQAILSYIYIFNSFFILRFNGGHFTFLLLLLLPLAIHLALTFNRRFRLLQLSLLFTYLLYAAVHYSTILILLFVFISMFLLSVPPIFKYVKTYGMSKKFWQELIRIIEFQRLIFLINSLVLALVIASPRLWLTFNYLHDNGPNRIDARENFFGIIDGLKALFLPFGSYTTPHATYGPFEASNYIGTFTGLVLLICIVLYTIKHFKPVKIATSASTTSSTVKSLLPTFITICIATFAIGLGGALLHEIQHLPVFSSMRVSTRYFSITAFCIIVIIGILVSQHKSSKIQMVLTACLLISLSQVFIFNSKQGSIAWVNNNHLDTTTFHHSPTHSSLLPPRAERLPLNETTTGDYKLTAATIRNYSQVITDNALVETRAIGSDLCDEDSPHCTFVLTSNARLVFWSPNHIIIARTQPGEIILNINSGAGWHINHQPLFKNLKVVTSSTRLTIPDAIQGEIHLDYSPY